MIGVRLIVPDCAGLLGNFLNWLQSYAFFTWLVVGEEGRWTRLGELFLILDWDCLSGNLLWRLVILGSATSPADLKNAISVELSIESEEVVPFCPVLRSNGLLMLIIE